MESESLTNGSHKEENVLETTKPSVENTTVHEEENVIKTTKPSIETTTVLNGNSESVISNNMENGHGEDLESKPEVLVNTEKENSMKKESTPAKRELRPRSTPVKDIAPKAGTPKREPKGKIINETPSTEQLMDSQNVETSDKIPENSENNEESTDVSERTCVQSIRKSPQKSAIVDVPNEELKQSSSKGFFSSLLSSMKTVDTEHTSELTTSSPLVVKNDSPSLAETYDMNNDIKGRRAIKAFSRFPGRNVSLSPSRKRKNEDDSCHQDEKKMCSSQRESGSEKSPGWRFLSSPFGRMWSPSRKFDTSVPTSTPFKKINDDDSMAVNFNETSKQSLDNTTQIITEGKTKPKEERSKCSIM